jgi:hypothetical protein
MLYVRTASGTFINAATIIQLSPQRAGSGDEITSWLAICDGGKAVTLAPYYAAPGRIDTVLDYLPPNARAISVPSTSGGALPYPSENCPCA